MSSRHRGSSATSAVGGFDDILFGTCGLLVLVLTVALAQIGIPEVSRETLDAMAAELAAAQQDQRRAEEAAARERAARSAAETERDAERRRRESAERAQARADAARKRAERERDEAEEARARAERAKSELEPRPCDVMICFDTTKSQADELAAWQGMARTAAEIGARLSPRFRIGVVAFNGDELVTLPLADFEGKTKERFQTFLDGLEIITGAADVEGATQKAISMLDDARRPGSRQLLVMCGDVADETVVSGRVLYDAEGAERVVRLVSTFAASSAQNRVLAIYTGNESTASRGKSVAVFKRVALSAAQRGTYSDDVTQLSATMIEALFGQ